MTLLAESSSQFSPEEERKARKLRGGVQGVTTGPSGDPFDVWWMTLSEADKLMETVNVARIAFRAGQKCV